MIRSAVVEHQQVAGAVKSFPDPLQVVLSPKFAPFLRTTAVVGGITPAVQDVATLPITAALVVGRLVRRCTVIDDVELAVKV